MAEQLTLPAPPTDHELSREFATRPNWTALEQLIEGVDGKELFEDRDFGAMSLTQIQGADAAVRDYLTVYDRKGGAYWESPFGAVEKAGEDFAKVRITEMGRASMFRDNCAAIMGQYAKARANAENEARRKLEQQQREDDERAKAAELASLNAQLEQAEQADDMFLAQDTKLAIEQVKSTPIIPTVVTPQQAAAAVGLPAMPRGLVSNKKPIYERVVVDKKKFIAWLAAHPAYIDSIAMSFSFTNLKHSAVVMDGVSIGEKHSTQNRSK